MMKHLQSILNLALTLLVLLFSILPSSLLPDRSPDVMCDEVCHNRPESSLTDPSSCTPSALEDLIDVLSAILVRRLEILEFLA